MVVVLGGGSHNDLRGLTCRHKLAQRVGNGARGPPKRIARPNRGDLHSLGNMAALFPAPSRQCPLAGGGVEQRLLLRVARGGNLRHGSHDGTSIFVRAKRGERCPAGKLKVHGESVCKASQTVHKLWRGARDYLCVHIAVKAKLSAQRLQAGNHALRGVVRVS